MERILTKEEAQDLVRRLPKHSERACLLIQRDGVYAYLCPEVRVSKSGRIRVIIVTPEIPGDVDPLLSSCFSLREKFCDMEQFKCVYGLT